MTTPSLSSELQEALAKYNASRPRGDVDCQRAFRDGWVARALASQSLDREPNPDLAKSMETAITKELITHGYAVSGQGTYVRAPMHCIISAVLSVVAQREAEIGRLEDELNRQKSKTEYEAERAGNFENDLDAAREREAEIRSAAIEECANVAGGFSGDLYT